MTTSNNIAEMQPEAEQQQQQQQEKRKRNKDFFVFNEFTIYHNLCAMKVGTDGVLLGGYASSLHNNNNNNNVATSSSSNSSSNSRLPNQWPRRILDIGCGSGLITMMLAQHYLDSNDSSPHIDAIDVDKDAIKQTHINLEQKPQWKDDNISVHHIPIQDYSNKFIWQSSIDEEYSTMNIDEIEEKEFTVKPSYDLVTCAPPYFISALTEQTHSAMLTKGGVKRKVARHLVPECSMTLKDLFSSVHKLLHSEHGRFCFIFPSRDDDHVMQNLKECGLSLVEVLRIRDNPDTQVIRHIYQCRIAKPDDDARHVEERDFSIYTKPVPKGSQLPQTEKRRYTQEYIQLLSKFCNHMFK